MTLHDTGARARALDSRAPNIDIRTPAEQRSDEPAVAVLLPCRDEEATIANVVRDFRVALPRAAIYVYDNASRDSTARVAAAAGATVRSEPQPGKGNVLRRMFADVDASVYVVADGDDTYDASVAPLLIDHLVNQHLDMVVASRVDVASDAYRLGHRTGNRLLAGSVQRLFGGGTTDMLSGYRALSRRYVKSFPAASSGFEAETEMTVHALDLSLPFADMPAAYRPRPAASASKLRTVPDGLRIAVCILRLCKDYRPLRFFGSLAAIAVAACAVLAAVQGGVPTTWSAVAVMLTASASLAVVFTIAALVLDSVGRTRREMKRMLYLTVRETRGGDRGEG